MPPRSKTPSPTEQVVYKCTARSSDCKINITTTYDANLHPLLGVLICRKCYNDYGDGNFAALEGGVDESGDDNFCRWCADGGDLFGCSNENGSNNDRCHYSFCRSCIERNLPDDKILGDTINDWHCYACNPEPLKALRDAATAAMDDLRAREFSTSRPATPSKLSSQKNGSNKTSRSSAKDKEVTNSVESTKSSDKQAEKSTSENKADKEAHKSKEREAGSVGRPKKSSDDVSAREKDRERSKERGSEKSTKDRIVKDNLSTSATTAEKQSVKDKERKEESTRSTNKEVEKNKEPAGSVAVKDTPKANKYADAKDKFAKDLKSYETMAKKRKVDEPPPTPLNQPLAAQEIFTPISNNNADKMNRTYPCEKEDLIRRLNEYRKTGELCVREISEKFDIIIDMFCSKEETDPRRRRQISNQIDSLNTPIQEFTCFIRDLRKLNNTL